MPNRKRVAVIFNQGLGDSLLMLPAIHHLRKSSSNEIHGIFQTGQNNKHLFEHAHLFDRQFEVERIHSTALRWFQHYDLVLLSRVAASKKWMLFSRITGKRVKTNQISNWLSKLLFFEHVTPANSSPEIFENLRLVNSTAIPIEAYQTFLLPASLKASLPKQVAYVIGESYFAIQISAGNNVVTYKNWPVRHWIVFLKLLGQRFPEKQCVLIGEKNEERLGRQIVEAKIPNVVSLIGKTTIPAAMAILGHTQAYIGLDSGWMHLCAAFRRPTFTLWGPSDPRQYGYEQFNPSLHRDISQNLPCQPCYAWPKANTSRVNCPENCPDKQCIRELGPMFVFEEFCRFWEKRSDLKALM